jgi:general secretion pathway protein H
MGLRSASRHAEAGVTLVEILVVLSIIAIAAGAVMLRLGIGRSDDALTSTAQMLALTLTQASDTALSTGEDRVLEVGGLGYSLHPASVAAVWTPLPDLTLTRSDAAPDPLRLAADGTSEPFQLRLSQGGRFVTVAFDGLRATAGAVGP